MPLRYPFSSTLLNQSVPENRSSPSWSTAPLTWSTGRHQHGWHHILWPGMVAEHITCLLYCLQVDCIHFSKVFKNSCVDVQHSIWIEFAKSCQCDHVQVQEEGRTMDKPWIDKWEIEKSHCIAMHRSSSCSNFHRIKMFVLCGKINWLKFAWIWLTIFIADVSVLRPFSRQVCLHTEQEKFTERKKVWWKQEHHFSPQLNR